MKPGHIQLGPSSCELRYSQLAPAHLRGLLLEITNLLTDTNHRGNNHASSLMQDVCQQADQAGITLMIMPEAFKDGPLNNQQLQEWYERRFRFAVLQQDPVLLIRLPAHAVKGWRQ